MSESTKKPNAFIAKHAEIWKFIKFTMAGFGSSIIELIVHIVLLQTVFAAMRSVPVTGALFTFLKMESKGYMFAFLISTTIGYTIAFVLNRKLTFHADSNQALSILLYTIMVIFTILVNTWIGTVLSDFMITKGWDNAFGDTVVKMIGMSIPTLWTYPLNRFVIHRKKKTVTPVV